MNDPYEIWNGEKFQFTLDKICKIVFEEKEYEIPEEFIPIKDKTVNRVVADNLLTTEGVRVLFDLSWNKSDEESRPRVIDQIEKGTVVFSSRDFYDTSGKRLTTIHVEDAWEAWIKLGRYAKKLFPMPTIGITGSAGKTTSTMFAQCVFNEKYRTFISGEDGKNFNTVLQIVNQWILRATPEYTFHVQECGGETPDLIKSSARVIDVDAFAINNIDTSQHLATYGCPENLIKDKTSFDRVRKETTVGVINLDDEILRNHHFESPLITYAIENKDADYIAENIAQRGNYLEFDVVGKGECVHIQINIIGKYNTYNALMVFALAKHFGLTNEEIQQGFLNYKSVGIRQNLREVAGRLLYMDCYNASVESTILAAKTLSEIEIKKNSKRIAIIGERKAANDEIYGINYQLGKSLAAIDGIDEYIVVGEDSSMIIDNSGLESKSKEQIDRERGIYDGLCSVESNRKVSFCKDIKSLASALKYQTKRGDAILFKGRAQLALWSIADLAFGTDYTKSKVLVPLSLKRERVTEKNYVGTYSRYYGGVTLTWGQDGFDNTRLIIPNYLKKYPVVRINDGMFKNNTQISMVIFGNHVRTIGDEAFYKSVNLEEVQLPSKCVYIGERAFLGCVNLVRVSALDLQHISAEAFKGCCKLKEILLSEKCMTIEKDAFKGCVDVVIKAPKFSYASKYALDNGIPFVEIDTTVEKGMLASNGTRKQPNVYSVKVEEKEYLYPEMQKTEKNDITSISVAFMGDIMAHDAHLKSFYHSETGLYDFSKLFENVSPYLKCADVAVGNVETTFGLGTYTGFPKFVTPESLGNDLSHAGLDVAAIANNHMFDGKYAGLVRTREMLELAGLAVCGCKKQDRGIAFVEKKGLRIAVLNYTYRTASVNGIATINQQPLDRESMRIANSFSFETLDSDLIRISADVAHAKKNSDIVLIYYHWGEEYEIQSNILQKYIAHKTADMGVDAIIGSHAHVIQEESTIETEINGKKKIVPVFYGLGNYCWGGRLPRTARETVHNGMLALLNIKYNKVESCVEAVETSYAPLYIKNDYIGNKYDFSVLSLNDMNKFEIEAFNLRSSKSVDEIKLEIETQLHPEEIRNTVTAFQSEIVLQAGARINILQEYFPEYKNGILTSENAIVASVLQNGEIIANKPGIVGVSIYLPDTNTETLFVVKVVAGMKSPYPILVNHNNKISDLYRPSKLCTGAKYKLGAVALEESAAKAWYCMISYLAVNKMIIKPIRGYETLERELKWEISCYEEKEVNPFEQKFSLGHSYHNYGTALELQLEGNKAEAAFKWLNAYAHRFGFVVLWSNRDSWRVCINYVGDKDVAFAIQKAGGDVEKYLLHYESYCETIRKRTAWKTNYISEEERVKGKDEWTQLTLGRIFEIMETPVPVAYRDVEDRIIPKITMSDKNINRGDLFFCGNGLSLEKRTCRNAMRKSAALAITDSLVLDEFGEPLEQIVVEDSLEACGKVCRYILERKGCEVVALETPEPLEFFQTAMDEILTTKFNLIYNQSKYHRRASMVETIQQVEDKHDFLVQEIIGLKEGFIEKNAGLLNPKVVIATGLKEETPRLYKNREAYEEDARSMVDYVISHKGIAVVNIDDSCFKTYKDMDGVFTISYEYEDADCYSVMKKKDEYIEVTMQLKGTESPVTIKLSKQFESCVTTVLGIYVMAYLLGMSVKELQNTYTCNANTLLVPEDELKCLKDSFVLEVEAHSIHAKWDDLITQAEGYDIRCYYRKNNRLLKGRLIKKETGVYTFSNLRSNRVYIVKLRAYVVKDGIRYFSDSVMQEIVIHDKTTNETEAQTSQKKGFFGFNLRGKRRKNRKER